MSSEINLVDNDEVESHAPAFNQGASKEFLGLKFMEARIVVLSFK